MSTMVSQSLCESVFLSLLLMYQSKHALPEVESVNRNMSGNVFVSYQHISE